ncbi:MAG: glycosyltransferase [Candidatus Thorarchaeota archaeon]
MTFLSAFLDILSEYTKLSWIIYFSLIYVILISVYNAIQLLISTKKLRKYRNYEDPKEILISDLKSLPLVNIIIPAWNEGDLFKKLLLSITKLSYPNIKVITNAGGSDETFQIAQSFKSFDNFVILYQKGGSDRPSLGKIKAINECLDHVSEGIIYFIDADSDINDDILLRMIHPLINLNEEVVMGGVRPLKNQVKKPLVKYLLFDRFKIYSEKFERHFQGRVITGQNFCISYNVLKSFSKFTYQKMIPTDGSMGRDIYSKGFKAYRLVDFRHRIYVDYSDSLKEYFHQRLVWHENFLNSNMKHRNFLNLIKFMLLCCISLYSLIFPILMIIDIRLLFPGVLIILTIYLKKLRRLLLFTRTIDKKYYDSYNLLFFFYIIFFIMFDFIINFYVIFHFFYFLRKLKKIEQE